MSVNSVKINKYYCNISNITEKNNEEGNISRYDNQVGGQFPVLINSSNEVFIFLLK